MLGVSDIRDQEMEMTLPGRAVVRLVFRCL